MKKLGATVTSVVVGVVYGTVSAHADTESTESSEGGVLEFVALALERISCFSCAI